MVYGYGDVGRPIHWYFCDPAAPFLPFPVAMNSLNWVDLRERVVTPFVPGEVPGTQSWNNGKHPLWSEAPTGYCGSASDYAGHASLGIPPRTYDWSGAPTCCRHTVESNTSSDLSVYHPAWNFNLFPTIPFGSPQLSRASNLPFTVLSNLPAAGSINGPWTVDLLAAIPTNPATLSDCTICDFPGYAQVQFYGPLVEPDDTSMTEAVVCGPHHFESTAAGGTHHQALGYVVCDAFQNVLWWYSSGVFFEFNHIGYLDVYFNLFAGWDYP